MPGTEAHMGGAGQCTGHQHALARRVDEVDRDGEGFAAVTKNRTYNDVHHGDSVTPHLWRAWEVSLFQ